MKPKSQKKPLFNYVRYSSMALQMAVIITVGILGGYKLDEYVHLKFPLFTVLFSFLSVAFAIYYVTRDLLKK